MKKILVILILAAGCFINAGCPITLPTKGHPVPAQPTNTPVVVFTPTVTPTP
jgi:hypothetical protein